MNGYTVNSTLAHFWEECYSYYSYHDGLLEIGIPSTSLFIFYVTIFFEFIVGVPSNLWLVCHILKKRYTFSCIFGVI